MSQSMGCLERVAAVAVFVVLGTVLIGSVVIVTAGLPASSGGVAFLVGTLVALAVSFLAARHVWRCGSRQPRWHVSTVPPGSHAWPTGGAPVGAGEGTSCTSVGCGGVKVRRVSRYGEFLGCSNYGNGSGCRAVWDLHGARLPGR